MSGSRLHVMVVGGGIGGLCLVQGLKKAGISVSVYERDRAPDARLQGYRLNIEPIGSRALHACLPSDLWNLLVATAGDPGPQMGVFDEQLRELMQEDEHGASGSAHDTHHAVSRVTLRHVLLAGLDDVVQFDKAFVRYEQSGDRVTAFFADGSSATGTLLVGADGVRSRVRGQLLPDARAIDTPAVGVGGKLALTPETLAWLPTYMTTQKNMILPWQDFLFTAAFRRRAPAETLLREYGDRLRAIGVRPEVLLERAETDYVLWAFVAHRHALAARAADLDGTDLRRFVERRMTGWHPTVQRVVAETDPSTVQAFEFGAAATIRPWRSTNVTLLGDALHYMPPVGGMGGNAALHDARLLCESLQRVARGEAALHAELQRCEAEMLRHGFAAVRAALWYTRLAIARSRPIRGAARTFFRLCGRVSPLRRAIF